MQYTDEKLMDSIEQLKRKMRRDKFKGHGKREFDKKECPKERPEMIDREDRPPHRRGPHPRHFHKGRERILRIVGANEPISQNKIAESFEIRPQSLSELLVKLESDGYITRTKNEDDKRETLVSLTDEGKKRSQEVEKARAEHITKLFAPLNQEEKGQLFTLVNKLLVNEDN